MAIVPFEKQNNKATREGLPYQTLIASILHKGYTINHKQVQKNCTHFLQAVEEVKHLLPSGNVITNNSVLDLVKLFADTWFSLDAFDKDKLVTTGATKKKIKLTAEKLTAALKL